MPRAIASVMQAAGEKKGLNLKNGLLFGNGTTGKAVIPRRLPHRWEIRFSRHDFENLR